MPTTKREEALNSWRAELGEDLPVLALPTDRPRSAPGSPGVHTVELRAGADVATVHHLLARAEDTTPFVIALAVTTVFLAQLSRQRDIVVGTRGSGWLALRTTLEGNPTFRDVVRRVGESLARACTHGDLPLNQLVQESGGGVPPLFRAVFTDRPRADAGAVEQAMDLAVERAVDLTVVIREAKGELVGEVAVAAALFGESSATRFAVMVRHLLEVLPGAPDEPVFARSPLPPAERERILHHLNPYRRPEIRYTTMTQPFEEQVRRTPNAEAMVGDEGSLTYAALNSRANQLAWFLRAAGALPGTRVVVSMERGFDLMVALYAVAKSGAAYVPIDSELPDARMAFMLEDSTPVAVLVDRTTRPRVPTGVAPVLDVDEDRGRWAAEPTHDLPPEPGNHLIHLLYTSGTTGRPKAVAYPVDGALADTFWLDEHYPYQPGDTAILKTSYGFDVSIWEIFWPLYCGSRVAICPPGAHRDPARLRDLIDTYQVTAMFMVPTMMPTFFDHTSPGSCPSLRRVYIGGEPVTPQVRDGFHERFDADLINLCGPTELGCMAENVLAVEPNAPVMIGTPPAHRRIYLLDDNLDPTSIGVPGELFVGGDVGIAQGYHQRPGLTAERFLADPHGPPGSRMYRTGDLCRYHEGGVLEHLGRVGRQVKVRGVRVELAEIEAVLAEHEDVGQCVVTVVPDRKAEIAAFVTPAGGRTVSVQALRAHATALLPAAMLPTTITVVDYIPTFVHGKTDVGALLHQIDRSDGIEPRHLEAPVDTFEVGVARIYCDLLGRDAVSVTESFFALGGHSVLVLGLIERCATEFAVELSVKEVVEALSARDLAATIARRSRSGESPPDRCVSDRGSGGMLL